MNNIRYYRKRAGMSLAELQRQTGISRRTLEDWESQKATPTVFHRIRTIANILGCTMEEMMEFEVPAIYKGKEAFLVMQDVEGGVFIRIYDDMTELYTETTSSELAFDLYKRYKDKDVWDLSYEPLFE